MQARLNPIAVVLAVIVAGFAFFGSTQAFAQTSDPDVTGHGTCQQAPSLEPSADLLAVSFDTFLLDRASRLIAAATRWQPSSSLKIVSVSQTRPISILARAR
ncbi:MAG TPA: hypothetical protein VL123_05535 [Candidatus Udaeobacter sp.]|jgi:hypothetical protein|nr:hypothetical protein [Candidatus Udaeobacter sp.]